MFPLIPVEMAGSMAQMLLFFVSIVGVFIGLMLNARA